MAVPRVVLMATELFAPGGVQQVGRDAMEALGDAGMPIEVWTLRDSEVPREFSQTSATIRCARGSRRRLIAWAMQAAAVSWRGRSVTVMHAHLAPLALPLHVRGASVAVMLHGVEVWTRLSAAERAALVRADRLIANSQFTARRFREANPEFRDAAIDICPLGLAPVPAQVPMVPIEPDTALIVSRLSSEDRYKGHDALLRAWPQVLARVPAARLVVAGDGDDRPRLESLAGGLGIADAVQFVGRLSDAELARWYERCGFFVLPSTGEGFGLVYLEAMRAGKACLACAGAAEEIIEPEQTGLILPDQEVDTLAAAIVRLYTDPALLARLGACGRARWRERFTLAHFAERFRLLTRPRAERAA